jgi:hypothetical protein
VLPSRTCPASQCVSSPEGKRTPSLSELGYSPITLHRFGRYRCDTLFTRLFRIIVHFYTYTPLTLYHRRGSRDISGIPPSPFYQNDLAMRNTAYIINRCLLPFDCSQSQVLVLLVLQSPFTTSLEERKNCYFYLLSRTLINNYQLNGDVLIELCIFILTVVKVYIVLLLQREVIHNRIFVFLHTILNCVLV